MTRQLLILGTGAFAEEVADLAASSGDYTLCGFVENLDRERCDRDLLGLPVHWIDDAGAMTGTHEAACAIGTTKRRAFVDQAAGIGFRFASLRHPSAVVAPSAEALPGAILGSSVVVGAQTRIGAHAILNRGVLIGHHTTVGECVTISPGANVAGRVTVGDRAYIGMGAIVLEDLTIGAGALVAAGSVVTRDVPELTQVLGTPARVVREGIEPR
jgi:sugar O-acyltransferase (sialic acid O-acetyltransferase NeuD family)